MLKGGDWSALEEILRKVRTNECKSFLEEEEEDEVDPEYYVNHHLCKDFGHNVTEVAIIGRETFSDRGLEYLRGTGVKKLSYYGPSIKTYPTTTTKVEEYLKDLASPINATHHSKYHLIVSLCSIQHFFGTEPKAKIFLQNISSMLKKGGKFICVYYSGSAITQMIRDKGNGRDFFITKEVTLEKKWTRMDNFGSHYTMIRDDGAITEESPLVFTSILLKLARDKGLVPVVQMSDTVIKYMKDDREKPGVFSYDEIGRVSLVRNLKNIVVFEK